MNLLKKLIPITFKKMEKLVPIGYTFFNGRYMPTRFGIMQRYIPVRYKSVYKSVPVHKP